MLTRPIEEVIKSLQLPDSLRSGRDFMLFHFAEARRMRGGPDIIFGTRIRFTSMKRYSFQQDSTNSP